MIDRARPCHTAHDHGVAASSPIGSAEMSAMLHPFNGPIHDRPDTA